MKVLDLQGVKFLTSINEKYGYNPKVKRLYLKSKYRAFKKLIKFSCVKTKIDPPYEVCIKLTGNLDIDNTIKPILDGLGSAGVIDNDRNVHRLLVIKIPEKNAAKQSLKVYVTTNNEYEHYDTAPQIVRSGRGQEV